MKIVIVIPAFNEEKSIFKVVSDAIHFCNVIVVDDCSTDRTNELATKAGAIVFANPCNSGYDVTIENGFKKAIELGYTHVITFDADGQHPISALPIFINKFQEGFEIVFGVRHKFQRLGEYLFSIYSKFKYGVRDPLSGLKGYDLNFYLKIGSFDTFGSIGTELSLRSLMLGARYAEVEYVMNERLSGAPRFGSAFAANKKIIKALFKSIFIYK